METIDLKESQRFDSGPKKRRICEGKVRRDLKENKRFDLGSKEKEGMWSLEQNGLHFIYLRLKRLGFYLQNSHGSLSQFSYGSLMALNAIRNHKHCPHNTWS